MDELSRLSAVLPNSDAFNLFMESHIHYLSAISFFATQKLGHVKVMTHVQWAHE